jgi:acylphosphatase
LDGECHESPFSLAKAGRALIHTGEVNGQSRTKKAKRWLISGTVQGVGFRFFVQNKAAALGIAGWARNLDDGRVEVYGIGHAKALSHMAAALHIGPRAAEVRHIEEHEEAVQNLSAFSVR